MRLNVGLFQQQTQKQILSPQMIQSMEILVLNQQQLEDRISGELEENVTLERDEQQEDTAAREIDDGESDQGPPDAVQDDAAGQQVFAADGSAAVILRSQRGVAVTAHAAR
jgi:DNA-directed RNA polymerase specialized sigma54-like protein